MTRLEENPELPDFFSPVPDADLEQFISYLFDKGFVFTGFDSSLGAQALCRFVLIRNSCTWHTWTDDNNDVYPYKTKPGAYCLSGLPAIEQYTVTFRHRARKSGRYQILFKLAIAAESSPGSAVTLRSTEFSAVFGAKENAEVFINVKNCIEKTFSLVDAAKADGDLDALQRALAS